MPAKCLRAKAYKTAKTVFQPPTQKILSQHTELIKTGQSLITSVQAPAKNSRDKLASRSGQC